MSDFDLTEIKALAWDVGGTVFDWHHSIKNEISKLAQDSSRNIDPAQFTNDWRTTMFELLQPVREGLESWKNADQLHLEALDIVLSKYDWPMTLKERTELNTIWHRLNAWPDAAENIEKLRSRYRVIVLTVLSWQIVVSSSKHNGISWDGALSCEFLDHYKPHPEAYKKGATLLGLKPEEVMMCAAHQHDLNNAATAGLRTAYVHRRTEKGADTPNPMPSIEEFDVVATDFNDLSAKLLA